MSWFAILSLLFSFQIFQVLQVLLWNSLWLYLSSRLLLLASQRRRFLEEQYFSFVDYLHLLF